MIDVLCVDKTGTLTKNELAVAAVRPLAEGWTPGDVLAFAALASSAEGQDPVDAAIRAAALATPSRRPLPIVTGFTPFDPTSKRSEAMARDQSQHEIRISKGAPAALATLAPMTPEIAAELELLAGSRVPDAGSRERPAGKDGFCRTGRPQRPATA